MTRYSSASGFDHAAPTRTAVLLVQLGTPDAPTPAALRRYLREFLSDPRVVEIPRLAWLPILHGVILRTRPAQSARKYATIWTDEGSPLLVHTRRQAKLLRGALGALGHELEVAFAMRYGNPSIPAVLRELRKRNVARLLVLPLYPQYAAATSATALDAVARELAGWRNLPELRMVRGFHAHDGYIDALAAHVRRAWERDGRAERLVMSFHGVPRRTLELGDPYHCECLATGRRLAERLGLRPDEWLLTFQSRFGRAEWLRPYTEPSLRELAASGVRSVEVICPGFVADCLETLEEIAIEGRRAFLEAGGREFRYLGCLNEAPTFIEALASIARQHLSGWPTRPVPASAQAQAQAQVPTQQR
ncbi:MAG: ferrochelatase [Burkholderiaceae bacterium]|nr:ferrochelatase [Burkholderiaceae bacterium]